MQEQDLVGHYNSRSLHPTFKCWVSRMNFPLLCGCADRLQGWLCSQLLACGPIDAPPSGEGGGLYIGIGVRLIMFSVTVIGFAADMGSILGDSHEDCHDFQGKRPRAASVVIAGFWLLDIAANMVDRPLLALLADLSGPGQRVSANAIYCLWGSLGGVLGYAAGSYAHWYEVFPFLSSSAKHVVLLVPTSRQRSFYRLYF